VTPARRRRPHSRAEDGQITAMLVLLSMCLLLAIVAVTDISGSYLRREAAGSLADGAALAASNSAVAAGFYRSSDAGYVDVDPAAASAAVQNYLGRTGAFTRYPGLDVRVVVEGHVVTVYLTMPYRLPVTMPGAPHTATIHASAAVEVPIY
jgi:Putative Flp pilus-assembly TadE/G-like